MKRLKREDIYVDTDYGLGYFIDIDGNSSCGDVAIHQPDYLEEGLTAQQTPKTTVATIRYNQNCNDLNVLEFHTCDKKMLTIFLTLVREAVDIARALIEKEGEEETEK